MPEGVEGGALMQARDERVGSGGGRGWAAIGVRGAAEALMKRKFVKNGLLKVRRMLHSFKSVDLTVSSMKVLRNSFSASPSKRTSGAGGARPTLGAREGCAGFCDMFIKNGSLRMLCDFSGFGLDCTTANPAPRPFLRPVGECGPLEACEQVQFHPRCKISV